MIFLAKSKVRSERKPGNLTRGQKSKALLIQNFAVIVILIAAFQNSPTALEIV